MVRGVYFVYTEGNAMVVKFREVGNSITVTIPKHIVTNFGLEQGMEAEIEVEKGYIKVTPLATKEKVTIKSLFAGYNGEYTPTEIDWGEPKGKEEW